jgi:hypothetical protein
MTGCLVSLLMALVVGTAYGLPSPLIGCADNRSRRPVRDDAGQQAVDIAKRRFVPPAQTSVQRSLEQ